MNNRWPISAKQRQQGGNTLVEVLVAVVIMAVSILGMGALLVRVHSNSSSVLLSSSANLLLIDMAERVTANRAAIIATPGKYTLNADTMQKQNCAKRPTTVAALELWEVACMAKYSLPSAALTVEPVPATEPTEVKITIAWDDPRGNSYSSSDAGDGSPTSTPVTLTQVVTLK